MRLSGRDIAEKIYIHLQTRVKELQKRHITPHLVVFLIGENPASVAYIKQKQTKGEAIGCKVTVLQLEETITTEELEEKLKLLNNDPFVHGILIQRPVPKQVDIDKLEALTNPEKDLDGFHPDSPYTLPLPLAVVKILEEIYLLETEQGLARQDHTMKNFINWLNAKNIVLTGKGPTGGGPIINYLKTLHVIPTVIDSKTPNPKEILKLADIVIAAVGRSKLKISNKE